jgi:hypothetical protein
MLPEVGSSKEYEQAAFGISRISLEREAIKISETSHMELLQVRLAIRTS